MPKDSKNGFYRQEQNIGRLISPFCVCIFTARSPPRPMVVHAARAAWRCAPFSGALEVTERRALRGYRGRTEMPQQNSQRVLLAMPTAHYPRVVRTAARWSAAGPPGSRPTAITPAIFARAPYRVRTAITHDQGVRRITRRAQWSCPNVRFAHTNRGCVIRHFGWLKRNLAEEEQEAPWNEDLSFALEDGGTQKFI